MSDGGLRFELERAITENELVLHYQPRVLVSTLKLRGVEALVRWRHPIRGIVSPAELVAAAERSGLMRDLDAWVIRDALLREAGAYLAQGYLIAAPLGVKELATWSAATS